MLFCCFTLQKLEGLKLQDKMQVTMIVIWVIELFLNQLGTLRDEGKENTTEYISLQKELDAFLARPQVMVSFVNLMKDEMRFEALTVLKLSVLALGCNAM
jgi:hypothetical protein